MKESDLHTKRTGHTEFVDKTSEAAKPINLEAPKAPMDIDESVDGSASGPFEGALCNCIVDLFQLVVTNEAF